MHTGCGKRRPRGHLHGAGGGEGGQDPGTGLPEHTREQGRLPTLGRPTEGGQRGWDTARCAASPAALGDSCARPGAVHTARPRPPRAARSPRGGCKGGGGAFAPGPPAPPIKSARGGRSPTRILAAAVSYCVLCLGLLTSPPFNSEWIPTAPAPPVRDPRF